MENPDRFRHPNNKGRYAFIEVPVSFLTTSIPEGWPRSTTKKPNGSLRQKRLREYVMVVRRSLDNTTALVMLSVREGPRGRRSHSRRKDLNRWLNWLKDVGYPEADWKTITEYNELYYSATYSEQLT